MAWIYLAESEESQGPWKATSDQSPTVKTTDTLKRSCCPECGPETFLSPQFGTTCAHYPRGICSYDPKSFMADSPAKTLALQDAEKAWAESEADYFSRSFASLARYDRDSSSWKMCQLSVLGEETLSPASWPASGMTVAGTLYPLQTWERTTDENGGGYLPTPRANKWGFADSHGSTEAWLRYPTPRAADADKNIRTPEGRAKERLRRKNGEDLPTVLGGKPNPAFIEWLMGYPTEWTVLEPWATQWFRPKREKRLKG